ncbi:Holliday junction branch migration protein RuvA [Candidatus Wolfebacteria bacterium]|nr:Holliday junction branch migration protein RuvA [Candidatus Wolfebacteria bacterium]
MLYSISGKLLAKKSDFAVMETNGLGLAIFASGQTLRKLPKIGGRAKLFIYLYNHQNGAEIYGFFSEKEREFFESLISINGIGARAALKILGVARFENLISAIKTGRSDFLVRAAGIGRKKAERIILELKDKKGGALLAKGDNSLELNYEVSEALKALGYRRNETEEAIQKISPKAKTLEEKIKSALKILSRQ